MYRFNSFRFFSTLAVLFLLLGGSARAIDRDLARFASAKQAQVREYAQGLTNKIPSLVWSLFDAVRVDDWETATNIATRLEKASGRYSDSVTNETLSPSLRSLIWPPVSEMIGAYDQFHTWEPADLQRFGRGIIDSIPRGSIYFGGTDPGRFIISAMCESHRDGRPFFTLTQNQLADYNYLEYLEKMYGRRMKLPTLDQARKVFKDYKDEARRRSQNGSLRAGEEVHTSGDEIQITGQTAVMDINGRLARIIFNQNPDREFYVEESIPVDWMYPHLSPHGLIFKLNAKPLDTLDPGAVRKDTEYWNKLTAELIGDWVREDTSVKEICDFADRVYRLKDLSGFKGEHRFAADEQAQKTFAKLRSAIAGLYMWRAEHARETGERIQMQKAADLASRQAFALCPESPEAVYRYSRFLSELNRPDDAMLVAKTALRLAPEEGYFQQLLQHLNRAE